MANYASASDRRLILKAIRYFEARIVVEDAFPPDQVQATWALEGWKAVQGNEVVYSTLPPRIEQLVRYYFRHARLMLIMLH